MESYYFKVNRSKESKKLQRQIKLACIRIKNKTGYTGVFDIDTALNDNDFIYDKITVRIKTQEPYID
jgi:hypothetical protein